MRCIACHEEKAEDQFPFLARGFMRKSGERQTSCRRCREASLRRKQRASAEPRKPEPKPGTANLLGFIRTDACQGCGGATRTGPHARFCHRCGPHFDGRHANRSDPAEVNHAVWANQTPSVETKPEGLHDFHEFKRAVDAFFRKVVKDTPTPHHPWGKKGDK